MKENLDRQPNDPGAQDSARVRKSGAEKETIFVIIGLFLIAILSLGLYLIYMGKDSSAGKLALMEQRLTAMEQRLALFEKQQAKLHEEIARTVPEKAASLEKIPSEKEKPPAAAKMFHHEVQKGETLFRIARRYGISVDELRRANNLPPEATLVRGQRLVIGSDVKG
jgi:LysM repeat protein